jgi:hypothetical protein
MINKVELQSIISKYYLNGLVEAVKWDVKSNKINIKFTSPTKEMIGEISCDNFDIQDSSVGISNTTQLLKLIGTTQGDLMISYNKESKIFTKLIISDNQFTINYALADTLTIPRTGAYTGPDEFNLETTLNTEIITALIKAKSALSESTTMVMKPTTSMDGDFELELIFGGDIEYANKISYFMTNFKQKDVSDFTLNFSSDLLKEILSANKDAVKAKMYVNLEGLLKFEFETDNTKSTYYMVKKDI